MCKINVQFQREKKYMYDEEIYIQNVYILRRIYAHTCIARVTRLHQISNICSKRVLVVEDNIYCFSVVKNFTVSTYVT